MVFTKDVEIKDIEDADGVDDEERDKPTLLLLVRRSPKGEPFPNDGPNDHEREPYSHRSVQLCNVDHRESIAFLALSHDILIAWLHIPIFSRILE